MIKGILMRCAFYVNAYSLCCLRRRAESLPRARGVAAGAGANAVCGEHVSARGASIAARGNCNNNVDQQIHMRYGSHEY